MQDLKELNEVIAGIKDEICKGAETLTTSRSVYEFKKTFLDNKQGRIGLLMKEMRNVPNDQKAEFGKTINGAKEWANQFFDELDQKLKEKEHIYCWWFFLSSIHNFVLRTLLPAMQAGYSLMAKKIPLRIHAEGRSFTVVPPSFPQPDHIRSFLQTLYGM